MSQQGRLIRVSNSTYRKLSSIGQFQDTFDSIICRMLENCDKIKVVEK